MPPTSPDIARKGPPNPQNPAPLCYISAINFINSHPNHSFPARTLTPRKSFIDEQWHYPNQYPSSRALIPSNSQLFRAISVIPSEESRQANEVEEPCVLQLQHEVSFKSGIPCRRHLSNVAQRFIAGYLQEACRVPWGRPTHPGLPGHIRYNGAAFVRPPDRPPGYSRQLEE